MSEYAEIFTARGHSYNEAGSRFPDARHHERQALLDLLRPGDGEVVVDAPAGGGYVAEGILAAAPGARVVCVEPAARFAEAVPAPLVARIEPIEGTSLGDAEADAVASLAGLHHFADASPVFEEWSRITRPGGRVAVADVGLDTATGAFLNGLVDTYTEGGHDGRFFADGQLSQMLSDHGFEPDHEQLTTVPWSFASEADLVAFCRSLFSITTAPVDALLEALEAVGLERGDGGVALQWQLRYARGVRRS